MLGDHISEGIIIALLDELPAVARPDDDISIPIVAGPILLPVAKLVLVGRHDEASDSSRTLFGIAQIKPPVVERGEFEFGALGWFFKFRYEVPTIVEEAPVVGLTGVCCIDDFLAHPAATVIVGEAELPIWVPGGFRL